MLSNDKKQTVYKVPYLHKIKFMGIGDRLFTSKGVIERKTDLIIQITPKIIEDAYTGIVKSNEVSEYEKYVDKSFDSGEVNTIEDSKTPSPVMIDVYESEEN